MKVGEKFGRWTVLNPFPKEGIKGRAALCLCLCGTTRMVDRRRLRAGNSKSCGCLGWEMSRERERTHGLGHSWVYKIWNRMISRCNNPLDPKFATYGARGIKVCDRWIKSVENFYADIGNRPFDGASLDRIDNNGDYCPENVKWSDSVEQSRNKTTTRYVEFEGRRVKFIELCEAVGINYRTAASRLNLGWSVEITFTTPVGGGREKTPRPR